MALKPWYTVILPRDDLRGGKPLDAAEFAVHLDQVRNGRAATAAPPATTRTPRASSNAPT